MRERAEPHLLYQVSEKSEARKERYYFERFNYRLSHLAGRGNRPLRNAHCRRRGLLGRASRRRGLFRPARGTLVEKLRQQPDLFLLQEDQLFPLAVFQLVQLFMQSHYLKLRF
jgi:hypothetical protein